MSERSRDLAFISYHQSDQAWRERLEVHLQPARFPSLFTVTRARPRRPAAAEPANPAEPTPASR